MFEGNLLSKNVQRFISLIMSVSSLTGDGINMCDVD